MARKKKEDIEFEYEFATFEDISSTTFEEPKRKSVLDYVKIVEDGFLNNLGKIIKIVSFVVAAIILLAFLGIGVVLSLLDSFFIFIAVMLFIVGIVLAAISMFLIFGMGQIITQNDEILKRFNIKK